VQRLLLAHQALAPRQVDQVQLAAPRARLERERDHRVRARRALVEPRAAHRARRVALRKQRVQLVAAAHVSRLRTFNTPVRSRDAC